MTEIEPETFTQYVDRWDALKGEIEQINKKLKPLLAIEKVMRDGIHAAVNDALGGLKEGVNKYVLPDMRVVKVTHNLDRKCTLDAQGYAALLALYDQLNEDKPPLAEVFPVDYKVSKTGLGKLSETAAKLVAKGYTTKPASCAVELA